MTITIGCDPEAFLVKKPKSKDPLAPLEFVTAHEIIPGTKQEPHKVPYGAVQVDGMAVELNIDPTSRDHQFSDYVYEVRRTLQSMLPSDLKMVFTPIAEFTQEYMDSLPAAAKEVGCDPDYDAYTMEENQAPEASSLMRTAGGHLHVGWTKGRDPFDPGHFQACARVARQLDHTLGLYTVIWDHDQRRRAMYGKAGAFRPKPYGVEYRVPSNFWLQDVERYGSMMCRQILDGMNQLTENHYDFADNFGETAREIINSGDAGAAREHLKRMGIGAWL